MKNLNNYSYFTNRELSWLEFNQRVLTETLNEAHPIFERMKFLSIASTNLDEFFMIRVASLRDQIRAGYSKPDDAGLKPTQQLDRITAKTHKMMKRMSEIYIKNIIPELESRGIHILSSDELNDEQKLYAEKYFMNDVYPVLTPMAADMSRPFPLLANKSLNIGVLIEQNGETVFATVQVPSVLPRLTKLPSDEGRCDFILLEELIMSNLDVLFQGQKVVSCCPYRITRNADLSIDEEEAADLLEEIKKSLLMRKWGTVIRLEVKPNISKKLLKLLKKSLEVTDDEIYYINSPINCDFLMKQLYSIEGYDELRYKPYTLRYPKFMSSENIFSEIAQHDLLLHHPYDSFYPVQRLLEDAAADPDVLAIKQTLYRVSGNSPIVKALSDAAKAGKQVTVLLEVKARFDEENNILWGSRLEKAGCHVIYGLHGLKTHSKITLIVRREQGGIKRYLHLGTGNYNDVTAKIYTDFGLLTADETMGNDATTFFNSLTGYSAPQKLNKLISAPNMLRKEFMRLIERETENARNGLPAWIFIKMNSLLDAKMVTALYEASRAGVKIRLLIRGICSLKPQIQGVSENIEVHSIVGRFLEHSRVFIFCNNDDNEVYLGSADMMPRNLNRRVELIFPIEDKQVAEHIKDIMELYWSDNCQTSVQNSEGKYKKIVPRGEIINAQEELIRRAFTEKDFN